MKKLLLPVDAAKLSERTLDYLKDFALEQGYEVTVLHVIPYEETLSHPHLATVFGLHGKTFEHVAEEMVANVVNQLKEAGIENISTRILKGNPAAEIVAVAEGEEFRLVLMNTHGFEAAKRMMIGSVTNKVVHNCYVPVLVIQ